MPRAAPRAALAAVTVPVVALAAGAVQAGQLEALEAYYQQVETVEGEFEQRTVEESGEVVAQSSGEFAIHRPDRFHWSYEGAFVQEIVADGERLWVYDVGLDQVTVRDQDRALGTAPAQLLAGDYSELSEAFEIEATEDFVRLTPRDGGQAFDEARLTMTEGRPESLEIHDALGQVTRVALSDVQLDADLDAERFEFEPPEGVDIYEAGPREGGQ